MYDVVHIGGIILTCGISIVFFNGGGFTVPTEYESANECSANIQEAKGRLRES